MRKIKLPKNKITKIVTRCLRKNKRTILSSVSIASEMLGLYHLYTHHDEIKDTVNDVKLICMNPDEKISNKLVISSKKLTPVLGPNILLFTLSTGCNIAGVALANKEIAGLTAGLLLQKNKNQKLLDTVTEVCSEEDQKNIMDKYIEKETEDVPDCKELPCGYIWCKDLETGAYFQTTREKIRIAEKALTERIFLEDHVTINELYDQLDAAHIGIGDDMLFNVDTGVDITIGSITAPNGNPILSISYCWIYDNASSLWR